MPKAPIDALLDTVEWDAHPAPADLEPGTLYATHSGTLDLGGVLLRVHTLSNGQRVIDERSILELLTADTILGAAGEAWPTEEEH